jgi:hypothetical protein
MALLAAAFMALSATSAQADEFYNPSCGANDGRYATAAAIDYGVFDTTTDKKWSLIWEQKCGTGGTVEWELQSSTDGGKHWLDTLNHSGQVVDNLFTTGTDEANRVVDEPRLTWATCYASWAWRFQVWDASGKTDKYLHPDGNGGGNNGC